MITNRRFAAATLAHRARARTVSALIVTLLLVAGCTASTSPSPSVSPSVSPSLVPTLEPTAEPTTDLPAVDIDEALRRLYAALDSLDNAALATIVLDDATHAVYYTDGTTGSETSSFRLNDYDLATAGFTGVEVTGEPLVQGDLVAVPVAYTYPTGTYYGIDLLQIVTIADMLMVGDGVTFYGLPDDRDPTAEATLLAEAAAWTAGDAAGVLALFAADGAFWDGMVEGSGREVYTGDDLVTWLDDTVGFTVETVGDPLASGAFVAAVQRLTGDTAEDTANGICVWFVRDGKIALHAVAMEYSYYSD